MISIGNSRPSRCRPRSSSRWLTTGASPVSWKRRMPSMCASRKPGGMIVSASCRPITSSRVQPNVASACAFHETIRPSESMPMKASCAVSRIRRARASLSARFCTACRRSSSASATTMRLASDRAKFCSSTVQVRGAADVLDAQHAERSIFLPQRHVEHGADAVRRQVVILLKSRVRGSAWASVGRDDAVVADGVEVGRHVALVEPVARASAARWWSERDRRSEASRRCPRTARC